MTGSLIGRYPAFIETFLLFASSCMRLPVLTRLIGVCGSELGDEDSDDVNEEEHVDLRRRNPKVKLTHNRIGSKLNRIGGRGGEESFLDVKKVLTRRLIRLGPLRIHSKDSSGTTQHRSFE